MSEHYDFHYQPTGSGAISGQQVLQQTEDAINELGDYVNDNVSGAMDVAQQALETAQNAEQDAQTALDTANSFSDAIQSAQQDANTALSTAQTAQTTATNANNTAIQAQQDASSAVTTANNASVQVNTLSGTVTALGQRVTTAEGNIGQNTSDITALGQRVTTAEGNITTLQNDVTIAQGNASSAMATAGQVKQQAFVFRYSSTALVASSTNSNTLLDNTDNLKVGDKVIDSNGVLFSVTAIDTANSTFTIGTALIDLAQDSDVVHKSGNETVGGEKTFTNRPIIYNASATVQADVPNLLFKNPLVERASTTLEGEQTILFTDKNNSNIASIQAKTSTSGTSDIILTSYSEYNGVKTTGIMIRRTPTTSKFQAYSDNVTSLGETNRRWSKVYAMSYYYGNDNVEFSTKFVTTDTNQTISGQKLFDDINIVSSSSEIGVSGGNRSYKVLDKNKKTISRLEGGTFSTGAAYSSWLVNNGSDVFNGVSLYQPSANLVQLKPASSVLNLQLGSSSTSFSDCYTSKINGVEPSSLSLPDLNNGIDISSYIPALDSGSTQGSYTPSVNGFIVFRGVASTGGCSIVQGNIGNNASYITDPQTSNKIVNNFLPVVKDNSVVITAKGLTSIEFIYFYPCQGNV